MKNELKNRREFFKEAAKKSLPILGMAVMAVAAPSMLQSCTKENNNCPDVCTNACRITCQSTCVGQCKSCTGSCEGSCEGSCKGKCTTTCYGSCKGVNKSHMAGH